METGINYPEVTIGGVTYPLKFTRGKIYRMGKLGVTFAPKFENGNLRAEFSQLVDVLHIAIDFPGTHEDLAELIYEQRNDLVIPVFTAWAKVVLPGTKPIQAQAATQDQPAVN